MSELHTMTHTYETPAAAPRNEPNEHDKLTHTYEVHSADPRIKPNGHDKKYSLHGEENVYNDDPLTGV
ncbi:unnamed protein product [Urochloa humidicola]